MLIQPQNFNVNFIRDHGNVNDVLVRRIFRFWIEIIRGIDEFYSCGGRDSGMAFLWVNFHTWQKYGKLLKSNSISEIPKSKFNSELNYDF